MRVARTLRRDHGFAGYIHLKTIPEANPWLIEEAGLWADRLSINLELPTEESLPRLAPEKTRLDQRAMAQMQTRSPRPRRRSGASRRPGRARKSSSAPMPQPTRSVSRQRPSLSALRAEAGLLFRFQPNPRGEFGPAAEPPPLQREHRLYQADWLMRYYGFSVDEIAAGGEAGMLDLETDPKLAWALKHRERFPVDINRAPRELLLRVPGLGTRAVGHILAARRHVRLRLDDVARLSAALGGRRLSSSPPTTMPPASTGSTCAHGWCGPPSSSASSVDPDPAEARGRPRRLSPGGARARRRGLSPRGGRGRPRGCRRSFRRALRRGAAGPAATRGRRSHPPRRLPPRPRALRSALRPGLAAPPRRALPARGRLGPARPPARPDGEVGAARPPQDARLRPVPAGRGGRRAASASSPGSSRTTSSSRRPRDSSSSASGRWIGPSSRRSAASTGTAASWPSARRPGATMRRDPIRSRQAGAAITRAPSIPRGSTSR